MDIVTYALCKKMIENVSPISGTDIFHVQGNAESIEDLPEEGNQGGDIYLVGPNEDGSFDEYYWLEGQDKWELMGSTSVDLSNYIQKGTLFRVVEELPIGQDIDPDVIYLVKQEGGQEDESI